MEFKKFAVSYVNFKKKKLETTTETAKSWKGALNMSGFVSLDIINQLDDDLKSAKEQTSVLNWTFNVQEILDF